MAEFALTIIGCGSALPMHGRHPSAQVIQYDDIFCLIDCGESTQMRLRNFGIKPFRISLILISHLHGDHVFGLPGLLSSFTHLQRKDPLTIYGPKGLKGLLEEIIKYTELKISYPLEIIESNPKGLNKIWSNGNLEILTFPLYHRIACNGYLIREISPALKLRKEKIKSFPFTVEQIHSLQKGEDVVIYDKTLLNSDFTYGPESPVSYAYCSDTRYDERIVPYIMNVRVLYHETTFGNELSAMAEQTGHCTAGDAGKMAASANAACLITGHYSSRYKNVEQLIMEAQQSFGLVLEAEEGKKYNLRMLAQQG